VQSFSSEMNAAVGENKSVILAEILTESNT